MTQFRILAAAVFAASIALAATAQAQPAPTPSMAMPMSAAAMPHDCGKPVTRHDHGAERGTPSPKAKSAPCAPTGAAAQMAEGASAPKKPLKHDHGKFHKNF